MFPGCPEHCNVEGTLSEYSWNIACRLGVVSHSELYYDYHFMIKQLTKEFEGEFHCLG